MSAGHQEKIHIGRHLSVITWSLSRCRQRQTRHTFLTFSSITDAYVYSPSYQDQLGGKSVLGVKRRKACQSSAFRLVVRTKATTEEYEHDELVSLESADVNILRWP